MFADDLKKKGWTEITKMGEYKKENWHILFDTSSWMIVETKSNPSVFDVYVPEDYVSRWTVNLIEHLCEMEDERYRLREALERIRDNSSSDHAAVSIAKEALDQCYHTWLVDPDTSKGKPGRVYCPICKQTKKQ